MMKLPGSLPYRHGPAELVLLPQHAIWWPAMRALVVADVHLGKGTAFRALGVPVPIGSSAKDLDRLSSLLQATAAEHLFILGDLIHGRRSHQPELHETMYTWRATHAKVNILLIRGNHDERAGRLPADLRIDELGPQLVDGLMLRHDPAPDNSGEYVLAGHVHPVIALRDFDRSQVVLPCFAFGRDGVGILPAFGSFTGGHRIDREDGQTCFACAAGRVLKIS
ncbi:MAG TPA: ligase-associated DNA damage response endonuclease PdeM [Tepidisphaeraceae bacterium]|jgi:DNA ligase-associated metallophosphoesterase|nr:ligase-associated DNA damage response endonuclease PdeM [Tepidisphaeraceae bacterium]